MSSEAKISYDLKRFGGIKRDYTPEQEQEQQEIFEQSTP